MSDKKQGGFQIQMNDEPTLIKLKQGPMRPYKKDEPLVNEVGIDLTLEPESGTVNGKLVLHDITTNITNKKDLAKAIENFINNDLNAKI